MSYIFGGNTGLAYGDAQKQRKMAQQLRKKPPENPALTGLNSGLDAIGDAITDRKDAWKAYDAGTGEKPGDSFLGGMFDGWRNKGESLDSYLPKESPLQAQDTARAQTGTNIGTMTQGDSNRGVASGIMETANALGIDPIELATAISYETAGTFDPTKRGPTTQWGQHRGLIQFGEPQARQHGVDWDDPIGSQLGPDGAVASYLRAAGVKPGMGLLDVYSAINAGAPGLYNRSDANNGGAPGTVADKVNNQMASHRLKAEALMRMLEQQR